MQSAFIFLWIFFEFAVNPKMANADNFQLEDMEMTATTGSISGPEKLNVCMEMIKDLDLGQREALMKALGESQPRPMPSHLNAQPPVTTSNQIWTQAFGRGSTLSCFTTHPGIGRGRTLGDLLRHSTPLQPVKSAMGYAGAQSMRNPHVSTSAFSGSQTPRFPAIGSERKQLFHHHVDQHQQPYKEDARSPRYVVNAPRLGSFSGDKKSEVTYRQWRAEVKGLLADAGLPLQAVVNSIRRSLKGMAAQSLAQFGEGIFDPHAVIYEFDQLFGEVLTSEQVLAKFYNSVQEPDESVAAWSCRVRDILSRCPDPTYSTGPQAEAMLRQRFWAGLRSGEIKAAIRHRYDAGHVYSDLLVAARQVEQEIGLGKPKPAYQLSERPTVEEINKIDLLLQKVSSLETEVANLKKERGREKAKQLDLNLSSSASVSDTNSSQTSSSSADKKSYHGTCPYCKKKGHKIEDCFKLQNKNKKLGKAEVPLTRGSQGEK